MPTARKCVSTKSWELHADPNPPVANGRYQAGKSGVGRRLTRGLLVLVGTELDWPRESVGDAGAGADGSGVTRRSRVSPLAAELAP
jgi:hypothetical protein